MSKSSIWKMLLVFFICQNDLGIARADRAEDEATLRKNIDSYVAAYNRQDAKAISEHWLPEAVYVDPDTDVQVVGRANIGKHFASIFAKSKGDKMSVQVDSIRFVSPHVALEQGTCTVIGIDKTPSRSTYSAVHIKRDGKWLLDRVTEEEEPVVTSHHEQLKVLDWIIGTWVNSDERVTAETSCQWSKNQNFIVRTFTISKGDQIERSGLQIIGWDPASKQIRSWGFNSDGGFGEGLWTKKGDRWHIQSKDVTPDGKTMTATNLLQRVNNDTFTVQSVDRQLSGNILPNIDEVVLTRKQDPQ